MTTPSRMSSTVRALMLTLLSLLLATGTHVAAQAEPDFTMQCGCPVHWSDDWDGTGVFITDEQLDLIVLVNETAVVLMHEIPADIGDLFTLLDARSDSLGGASWIGDLEEFVLDEGPAHIVMGRLWDAPDGELMVSVHFVQVWLTDFFLSIEFVAPEDDFVALWNELDTVTVIGEAVLQEFTPDEILDALGL